MKIVRLDGTDKKLYELVAPLVMNAAVLRFNNNYPFKTSPNYIWYVAVEEDQVLGFIPIKKTTAGFCIDNYYYVSDNVFETLLDEILKVLPDKLNELQAVVHKRDVKLFKDRKFTTIIEWTKYSKMIKSKL